MPLSPAALEVIRRRLAVVPEDLLFPVARKGRLHHTAKDAPMTWSSRFVRELRGAADEQLGEPMPRWTIHNIRHTAGTHMREDLKVSREVVSIILGHALGGS